MRAEFVAIAEAAAAAPGSVADLVNWQVSGVARLVAGAAALPAARRPDLVRAGVRALLHPGEGHDPVDLLGTTVAYLDEAPELVEPTTEQDRLIRDRLRCPALPDGIDPASAQALAGLGRLAGTITDTAVLRFAGDRRLGLAVGAFDGVALVRDLPPD